MSIGDVSEHAVAAQYGDLPTMLALTAPTPLWLAGEKNFNSHREQQLQFVLLCPLDRAADDDNGDDDDEDDHPF